MDFREITLMDLTTLRVTTPAAACGGDVQRRDTTSATTARCHGMSGSSWTWCGVRYHASSRQPSKHCAEAGLGGCGVHRFSGGAVADANRLAEIERGDHGAEEIESSSRARMCLRRLQSFDEVLPFVTRASGALKATSRQ